LSSERGEIGAFRIENADLLMRCRRLHGEAKSLKSAVNDTKRLGDDRCAAMQGKCIFSRCFFVFFIRFCD
jgi:hypothetical protein